LRGLTWPQRGGENKPEPLRGCKADFCHSWEDVIALGVNMKNAVQTTLKKEKETRRSLFHFSLPDGPAYALSES